MSADVDGAVPPGHLHIDSSIAYGQSVICGVDSSGLAFWDIAMECPRTHERLRSGRTDGDMMGCLRVHPDGTLHWRLVLRPRIHGVPPGVQPTQGEASAGGSFNREGTGGEGGLPGDQGGTVLGVLPPEIGTVVFLNRRGGAISDARVYPSTPGYPHTAYTDLPRLCSLVGPGGGASFGGLQLGEHRGGAHCRAVGVSPGTWDTFTPSLHVHWWHQHDRTRGSVRAYVLGNHLRAGMFTS